MWPTLIESLSHWPETMNLINDPSRRLLAYWSTNIYKAYEAGRRILKI